MLLVRSIRLCTADIKRMFRTPKLYLVLLFVLFFLDNYARGMRQLAARLHIGITPYVYPVYMSEWQNRIIALMAMVVIMSDAPFKNGSEKYIFLRASKYEWILSKIFYVIFSAALLQLAYIVLSVAVCFPYIGFSSGWGSIITTISNGMAGSVELGPGYTNLASYIVLNYSPVPAMLQQISIAFLLCIVVGFMIMLINTVFKNYIGTVIVVALLLAEYFINMLDWLKPVGKILKYMPGTWLGLNELKQGGGLITCASVTVILSVTAVVFAALLFVMTKVNKYRIMEM